MTYTKNNITFGTKPSHPNFKDITGTRYGRLIVIGFSKRENVKTYWFCECDCGNIKETLASYLQSGRTQSCGCLFAESPNRFQVTHGMRDTPEYSSYVHAKERCDTPTCRDYPSYGGRGIEFRFTSFEEFFEHIGNRPSPEYSLDRIDVNGHYEIGNIRWATAKEQARNTRFNRYLTANDRTRLLVEWSEELNVTAGAILHRLKQGWSEQKALTTPFRPFKVKRS